MSTSWCYYSTNILGKIQSDQSYFFIHEYSVVHIVDHRSSGLVIINNNNKKCKKILETIFHMGNKIFE